MLLDENREPGAVASRAQLPQAQPTRMNFQETRRIGWGCERIVLTLRCRDTTEGFSAERMLRNRFATLRSSSCDTESV
jgi:hypothetical protein